jgi:hypothetical protein
MKRRITYMNENVGKFFDALGKDAALRKKLEATKSADEAYKLALTINGGYTLAEFLSALKGASTGELAETDLDAVTGGSGKWTIRVSPGGPGPRMPQEPGREHSYTEFGGVTITFEKG